MEVSVYQLAAQPFSKAFPKLLETIIAREMKVVVYCADIENAKQCDMLLWSFEQLSFLPHQMKGDKSIASSQAIYITDEVNDNPYDASVLAFYNVNHELIPSDFARVVYMISPDEAHMVDMIMHKFKQQRITCSLLIQQENGSWRRKE